MDHLYALIMAGGGGTRLWPLSRRSRPKQALALTEKRTMIQITVDRLKGLLPVERIYIIASRELSAVLHESVPQIPAANFIIEPEARNSGPAAGYGTFVIEQHDPEAVVAVLSADHHIANEDMFQRAMRAAYSYAGQGYIVTIGIAATFPSTGFGYIRRAGLIGQSFGLQVYRSAGFREKPDTETAIQFLSTGMYSWNAGMFVWKVATLKREFERQQPVMAEVFTRILAAPDSIMSEWNALANLSIDYAIMEKAENVAVIPVDLGWSDVGTWALIYDILEKDANGNASRHESSEPVHIDATNTLIFSEKTVVLLGVSDLVVVETPDAILIVHRDRAQDVKAAVDALKARGRGDLT